MMRHAPNSIFVVALFVCLGGCAEEESASDTARDGSHGPDAANEIPANEVPLPEYSIGRIRVYSPDDERFVLIDGHLARDENGQPLQAPCEVAAEQGSRTVTLSAAGFQDISRVVSLSELADVDFPPLQEARESSISTADASLFSAKVGEPIPLAGVNSRGAELDPYLSPDGLTLWFAGDRTDGGRAIYYSYRPTIWHDFESPEALLLTRGPSIPASPSLSSDGLQLYYAVSDDARLWSISRDDALASFLEKETVLFDAGGESTWPATQVLPDRLRAYWIERKGERRTGYAAVRSSPEDDFGSKIEYPLPGLVPALAADGLRQYLYDGRSLRRSRRAALADNFSAPEEVMPLELPGYVPTNDRRQFCVSDDEQWMVYCADPEGDADLYLVRLSESPGWGVVPLGKAIPPRQMVAETNPKPSETNPMPEEMEPEKPDPRTLPLPFAEYAREWRTLVAERKYAAAEELTRQSLDRPELADSRSLLETDLAILNDLREFKRLTEAAFKALKPGDEFSFGSARAKLSEFKDGLVRFQAGGQDRESPFFELPMSSLSLLVRPESGNNAAARSRLAFLLYDKDAKPSSAVKRIDDEGLRQTILSYATDSLLHEAELEFARDNYVPGFAIVRQIEQDFAGTAATERTDAIRRELYTKTDWEIVGGRKWERDAATGEYRASAQRADDSYLKSPKPMKKYELQFEWTTSGDVGQGGVYFHYPGTGRIFQSAFKIHLANDAGTTPDSYSSGSLFSVEAPSENAVKPQPEWNSTRMVVNGSDVTVWINGVQVLETLALSDVIPEEGYVVLDGIPGGIAYRRILLFEIP